MTLAAKPFAAAVNHLLARESWARDRLIPYAGKTARLEVQPVTLVLLVQPDGYLAAVEAHDARQFDVAELGITHGLFGDARASTVVSGLPLVAMPVEQAIAIVHGAFAMHLGPGGAFYQFTYLPRCPIPARRLAAIGIRAERIGIAWANVPPAAVYRLQRHADFSGSPSSLGHPWPGARPPSTAA